MPELPEVEVTRRCIEPLLVGRTVAAVATTAPSYFFLTAPARLRRALRGRAVRSLARRGKYLVAGLDDESRLLLHLGMTGQLFASGVTSLRLLRATGRGTLAPEAQRAFQPDEHTHLRLRFADAGPEVWLRDARKFGKVQWIARGRSCARLDRLGVDALEASGAILFGATRGRRAAIKSLLLDQSVLAGIGNIYADEALFRGRVRPGRAAGSLARRECEAVADALRAVLERAIESGGSSIRDYLAPDGKDGAYQDERRVYARDGAPCYRCGTAIRRRVIGQRSTHYCPCCQR